MSLPFLVEEDIQPTYLTINLPISIGGTTEGAHYYSLLTIPTFKKHFTASSFIDTRSDIPWVLKVSSYEDMQNVPQVQNPIKKAVTAIFNCGSKNNRETIVMEMSKIIPIDIIGNCLRNVPWPMCGDQPCKKDEVLKKYMFCLVFENGVSPGFVSEKIHQCFRAGSLPIWYGTEDVALLVPKGSYVDMRDFQSHLALAEYMVKLTNNETLYNSYFEWKKRPLDPDYVRRNKPFWEYKVQCRVCRYVWVKQRGLMWDRVTQNSTVILNASPDTNQLSLTLDKVTQNTQGNLNTAPDTKLLSLTLGKVTQNTQGNLNTAPDTKLLSLTLDKVTQNTHSNLNTAPDTKLLSLTLGKVTQNTQGNLNTAPDTKLLSLTLGKVTQNTHSNLNATPDTKLLSLTLGMVTQNATVILNTSLDLNQDPSYVNYMKLLFLLNHNEKMAKSLQLWTILLIISFVLVILTVYMCQVLRLNKYFKWFRDH